ncbi:hypothetical protein BPAE_0812g00010 [Botrytis paeoniae]|uniref:Uncharacterized protein n=1 Tax=Botrytis paeoniae TaxID=278948 RepID=A0A4Z1EUZ8_9HELO|nr:hypothetical protein BPAE_0812g00010 [Botrytis paeoniae]
MNNKNYRGRAPQTPACTQDIEAKLAAEKTPEEAQQLAEHNQNLAIPYESHTKKVEVEHGAPKLFIQIDMIHPNRTAKEVDFFQIFPKYAPMVKNVEIHLIAPTFHSSVDVYNLRIKNMIKTIDVLSTFDLENLHFIISVNRPDNFQQMKLAAAGFDLNFDNWTMGIAPFGDQQKEVKVGFRSLIARRLAGVYRSEFLNHKVL